MRHLTVRRTHRDVLTLCDGARGAATASTGRGASLLLRLLLPLLLLVLLRLPLHRSST